MGKIYYMMGKSSSGKDTIYKDIRKDLPELKTLTLYTTRPMREGEKDGVEYYFVTDEILEKYREEGKIIEDENFQETKDVPEGCVVGGAPARVICSTDEFYKKRRSIEEFDTSVERTREEFENWYWEN